MRNNEDTPINRIATLCERNITERFILQSEYDGLFRDYNEICLRLQNAEACIEDMKKALEV